MWNHSKKILYFSYKVSRTGGAGQGGGVWARSNHIQSMQHRGRSISHRQIHKPGFEVWFTHSFCHFFESCIICNDCRLGRAFIVKFRINQDHINGHQHDSTPHFPQGDCLRLGVINCGLPAYGRNEKFVAQQSSADEESRADLLSTACCASFGTLKTVC